MSSAPGPNPNVPQIQQPVADLGALANTAQSLKQGVDSLAGFRGDILGRAVTFNDLIRLGLVDKKTIQSPHGAADFATNSALTGAINGIPGTAHVFTAEQIISVPDNTVALFIEGSVRGARYYETTSGSFIEGRDNNNSVYEPITLGGSTVNLSISGSNEFTLTSSGLTVSVGASFSSTLGVTGAATLSSTLGVTGAATLSSTLGVTGAATLSSTLGVSGAATFSSTAQFNGAATFASTLTANSTVSLTDGVTVTGAGIVAGAPTGGDKGTGTVNATGLYLNGVGLQSVANHYDSGSKTPLGTNSASAVMMGLAGSVTPSRSGVVLVMIFGYCKNSNSGGSLNIQLAYGTGSAPANGAALTGSTFGVDDVPITASAGQDLPFALGGVISGLSAGTAYWLDIAVNNNGAGTASIPACNIVAVEL